MNIFSETKPSISTRKQHHIDICKDAQKYSVESLNPTGFAAIQFVHNALPELSVDEIDTSIDFLQKTIRFPLFISCMTGGSEEGFTANQELAKAAQKCQLPIGLGSIRVAIDDPNRLKDFQIRNLAPDVPVMANLGAVQARDIALAKLRETLKSLEVDALVLHLNCGQELFQVNGDRDFRGVFDAIQRTVEGTHLPVIVKETGFGISTPIVKKLIKLGVEYVDLAGSGGTNWILVENHTRSDKTDQSSEFSNWGIPTAVLVDATQQHQGKVLASGGIRSGMDLAKAVALGAVAGGVALPLFRAALEGGCDSVCTEIEKYYSVFHNVMTLTGSRTVAELHQAPIIKSFQHEHYVNAFEKISSL